MAAILITGGSGLLAVNWAARVSATHAVSLAIHTRKISLPNTQSITVNLESMYAIRQVLDELAIDLVVHTAAMTDIEACEADPEHAHHVNVALAQNVANATREHDAKLIHISTDHLFNGSAGMWAEDDPIAPVNVYSATKAEAENAVLEACPNALVIRTNFYGWGTSYRRSFSDAILASLHAGRPVNLFQDVYYTPILIDVLVDATHKLLTEEQAGIFNIVGDQRITKFDFGLMVAAEFGLDSALIHRSLLSERRDLVSRPFEMSLSNRKACSVLGGPLGSVRDHLARMRRESIIPQASLAIGAT
jgi:dTDP-4-dehydrorhamnose reductase